MQHLNERHLVKQGLRFWFATPTLAPLTSAAKSEDVTSRAFPPFKSIVLSLMRRCYKGRVRLERNYCVRRLSRTWN